ncbi:hypothetical protein ACFQY0_15825 [Haloferula chungangensis]|uniref:Uncharacterized protein n=1 Tax=Haloferula chungangensis TaxID=1048331 RepID=A0ABW2LA56_9BACT
MKNRLEDWLIDQELKTLDRDFVEERGRSEGMTRVRLECPRHWSGD